MKSKQQKKPVIWIIVLAALVIIACIILLITLRSNKEGSDNDYIEVNSTETFSNWNDRIIYKGEKYRKNTDISTILFMGIDNADFVDPGLVIGRGGRADSIFLVLLDQKQKTAVVVPVSRDTITQVDLYDENGSLFTSGQLALATQYAYGTDPVNSCEITRQTVSRMLLNLEIDHYAAIDLAGVIDFISEIGGLTLTFPADYTYIDPLFQKDAVLTLDGYQVEYLIRYRDKEKLDGNLDRMERQSWVVREIFHRLKERGILKMLPQILTALENNVTTDLDLKTIRKVLKYELQDERHPVPGEMVDGGRYAEFHIDEEALMDLLIQLYYEPVN